jgi:dienelactone hydrolase
VIQRIRIFLLPWLLVIALASAPALQHVWATALQVRNSLSDGDSGHIRFRSANALAGGLLDGRPITPSAVDGELTLPGQCTRPFPAVVVLHGSLGVSKMQHDYARALNRKCYAVLVVDSFTGRGVRSTVANQLAVTTESMVIDAYAALVLLQSDPAIDRNSIALAGWSKGGTAVELAMSNLVRRKFAPNAARFAAHVAFYPWCGEQTFSERNTGAPILFILAKRDDWVSSSACSDYAMHLRDLGVAIRVESFDAAHAFDSPGSVHLFFPDAIVSARCRYEPRSDGFRDIDSQKIMPWAQFNRFFSACSSWGAHIQSDARAASAARSIMFDFLDQNLKTSISGGPSS